MFEVKQNDLAGRIGILHTNHGKIETPAYVPVIHPVKQTISCKKIKSMGFDLVITNAYITMKRHGENAVKQGIHKIIDFDGAIMTDSGGYQVLEYGDVDVMPPTMADFERKIMTDFAIPLDKPTGYGLTKKKAITYVNHTLKVTKETIESSEDNGQIWMGPIQGSEYSDLVKRSTKSLILQGYKMLALGSPVEFMESYEYRLLAEMIISAKKNMPSSIPLHLFGAGHPLTIPLAVALGCDTFDSASYILYAKHDRYIEEDKTSKLSDMTFFSCTCEVCTKFKPRELLGMHNDEKINNVALHNLFAIKSEVDRVKEAIMDGRLWEYTIKKARAHPKLFETISTMAQNHDFFIKSTPKFKEKAIFLFSIEDQYRPEVISFHDVVRKFKTKKSQLVIAHSPNTNPAYLSSQYHHLEKKFDEQTTQICHYNPFLGIIPIEISDLFPASHFVMVRERFLPEDFAMFKQTWIKFFENNLFETIYLPKDDKFIKEFIKLIPKGIKKRFFKN